MDIFVDEKHVTGVFAILLAWTACYLSILLALE
jgi:hypothetical protein